MDYVRLGRAGAEVSRIALGTMNLGPVVDEAGSFEILDRALELGVTLFDTADEYGGPPLGVEKGSTELLLGRWLAARGVRDAIVLATKVHNPMGPGRNDRGLSAVHIRQAVEASLRRLGTDRIDLYQMHHVDRAVPVDEVLEAFTTLRDQGKILYLGTSNFAGWHLAQYQERAEALRLLRPVTEQSLFNLAERTVELEVAPAARHYGVGLLPWSPLASGLLGGVLAKRDRGRSGGLAAIEQRRGSLEAYEALAAREGLPPGGLALAWLLHHPAVTAPIVGPRTVRQLEDAVAALEIRLDDGVLGELDAIWPGPGAPAPEAYAW